MNNHYLHMKIKTLFGIILLIFACSISYGQILITTSFENKLRIEPSLESEVIQVIPAHRNLLVVDFVQSKQKGDFFEVKINGVGGFVQKNLIACDDSYYFATSIINNNAADIYKNNKTRIDRLNKIKIKEEEVWMKKPMVSKKAKPASYSKVIQMKKMSGGTFEIPCRVNGLELQFIFDTGASDVSISLTEAIFMFKNGYLSEKDITGTQTYSIANGDIAEGTTIIIRELEFGGLTLTNVEASIVHEMQAPLLLGQSAISRLGTIQIDPNKATLTIVK